MLLYALVPAGPLAMGALNAANEAVVANFLAEKIGFTDIPKVISRVMESCDDTPIGSLD